MTCLAFDYGLKRIGVAVGEQITGTARALPSISNAATPDWAAIDKLVSGWKPQAIVVGLPLDEDGGEQPITAASRAFAVEVETRFGVETHLADERFSSRAADDALRQARASGRMTRRVRKGDRDGESARVILEQWMSMR